MADLAGKLKQDRDLGVNTWMEGLEPLTIGVSPEIKGVLEKLAKRSGKSLEKIATMFLNEKAVRFEELQGLIEKEVKEALEKEYGRFEQTMRALVAPSKQTTETLKALIPLIKGRNTKRFSD